MSNIGQRMRYPIIPTAWLGDSPLKESVAVLMNNELQAEGSKTKWYAKIGHTFSYNDGIVTVEPTLHKIVHMSEEHSMKSPLRNATLWLPRWLSPTVEKRPLLGAIPIQLLVRPSGSPGQAIENRLYRAETRTGIITYLGSIHVAVPHPCSSSREETIQIRCDLNFVGHICLVIHLQL